MNNETTNALNSPRFCNTGNFMRLPKVTDLTEQYDFVIVGIPFDTACSYRVGARFGPSAIRQISSMIKPNNAILGVNVLDNLKGADYGDISVVPGYILPTYKNIEHEISQILSHNTIPISLGGDHSVTLAELRAIAKYHGPVSLIHFDSHADINDLVFGEKYGHGTPFRRAVEENLIDAKKSIQIGMRGSLYDKNEFQKASELGFELIPTHKVREMGFDNVIKRVLNKVENNKTFLTFDIDFVDPAYAPGTGTPEVGGFTSYEALSFVRALKDVNFVGFDVVEVSPPYDSSEITSYLGANIAFEFISILALKKT